MDDLDEEGIKSYVARLRDVRPRIFGDKSIPEILTMSNVLVRRDATLIPTLAGLLALGRYPQQFYPQLMLTFVSYPTVEGPAPDGTRFLDNVAIEGSIPEIVRESLAVIKRNMRRRAVVAGAGRQDIWDYPEPALREAIVNAVVHRDLSPASFGAQVQVEMYPDRLEVRNPGGLFGPVQIDSLGTETLSSARNSALLKMLEDVKIPGEDRTVCENRGSGIRTMLTALRAAGMSPPEFSDKISSFTVRFPNHTLLNTAFVDWIATLHEPGLTHSQIVALAHMREGALIDNPKYRQIGGVDSRVATQELQDLVVRELADQEGTGRGRRTRWHQDWGIQKGWLRRAGESLRPIDAPKSLMR
ncbi:ATP-binding protein [Pseudarthrobacter sp. AL07]|uniref:ATP-binding protein n=1 Tax=unclassified Pseudarthrobacter TaxID=2647000 RepID=UPI00249B7D3C|nr:MULTISPECIES: ATP-binding protein [unclassified Pseudarthrobacter]MDI3195990.1 ATP-binding protein [Pseudarthrobacter sp. AL20]MDI3210069.1 ATP-binding protein [Pseudarthrobacter sp. AL07]